MTATDVWITIVVCIGSVRKCFALSTDPTRDRLPPRNNVQVPEIAVGTALVREGSRERSGSPATAMLVDFPGQTNSEICEHEAECMYLVQLPCLRLAVV